MKARVYVTLKQSVFDPQGSVVAHALTSMGYGDVKDVRQGKFFQVELEGADAATARARVTEMADRLLANPVFQAGELMRLFVGDDWAEDHHDVELMNEQGRVLARGRLPEGVAGMARLHELIGAAS